MCCTEVVILLIFCALAKADLIAEDSLDWWQKSVIYQIIPRSFKDSDADGIGDLKGIEEKVEYFEDLRIDAIWLTPIYESPMTDLGYDVSNFKGIDPIFGTMEDFESLRDKLHSSGIKLILDFIPNHSSDKHEWFIKSLQKIDPYTDYYVWKDPNGWINETTPLPPNNWIGVFHQPTWTYRSERKQFYLHQFTPQQPDLNYRSEELFEEMKNVIRFWLDKGVDGFRMDAVIHLVEDDRFLDEPLISSKKMNGKPVYRAFDHKFTQCVPGTFQVLREFRKVMDSYKEKDAQTRLLIVEVGSEASTEDTMRFYGNRSHPIAHIPFNFFFFDDSNDTSTAADFQNVINRWMNNMPNGSWPNWVLGNHDMPRVADRYDPSSIDSMNMLLLLLPGTPTAYYGDEIGMTGTTMRWDQTNDVYALNHGSVIYRSTSRDPQRTPFQWNSSSHAGFSDTNEKTWLPVNPNYYKINARAQKKELKSHYNIFKSLIKLRSSDVFQQGDFKMYNVSERIFAFKRNLQNKVYVIVMNLNNEEEYVDMKNIMRTETSKNFIAVLASENSEYDAGDELDLENQTFRMRPKSGIVLRAILEY